MHVDLALLSSYFDIYFAINPNEIPSGVKINILQTALCHSNPN